MRPLAESHFQVWQNREERGTGTLVNVMDDRAALQLKDEGDEDLLDCTATSPPTNYSATAIDCDLHLLPDLRSDPAPHLLISVPPSHIVRVVQKYRVSHPVVHR